MPLWPILFKYMAAILFLTNCSVDQHPSRELEPKAVPRLTKNTLIIVNGLSEDFTVVKHTNSIPEVARHVAMDPEDNFGEHPCQAPNHIDQSSDHIYVTCSLSNEIHIFANENLALKRIVDLGSNINPWSTVIDGATGYVTSFLKDKVIRFSPSPEKREDRILGEYDLSRLALEHDEGAVTRAFPEGIIKINQTLYVAVPNLKQTVIGSLVAGGPGYLVAIDTAGVSPLRLIKASGRNTVSVYHSKHPQLKQFVFAINAGTYDEKNGGYRGDGSIDQIELATESIVRTIAFDGAPFELAISQDGLAYVSNGKEGKLLRFNALTGEKLPAMDLRKNSCNDFSLPRLTYISAIHLEATRLYATDFNSNCLFIIDTQSGELLFQLKTGDGPQSMISTNTNYIK